MAAKRTRKTAKKAPARKRITSKSKGSKVTVQTLRMGDVFLVPDTRGRITGAHYVTISKKILKTRVSVKVLAIYSNRFTEQANMSFDKGFKVFRRGSIF